MSLPRKSIESKESEKEKTIKIQKNSKLTIPEIYPDNRLENSKIPVASDENIEYARDWIQINKL